MNDAIRNLFQSPARREWSGIDIDEIIAKRTSLREKLVVDQTEEVRLYAEREPAKTADADAILAWEEEGRELKSRHERELANFDQQWAIEDQVAGLNALYSEYGSRHAELTSALSLAEASVSEDATPLEEERGRLQRLRTQIETEQNAIVEQLHKLGVTPADHLFTGWETGVQHGLFVEACEARRIDPERAPVIPLMPATPTPIEPVTVRKLEDKSPIWKNIALLIGGLALGSAAGAATGGITFDSDGWHFNVVFWIMLTVGTVMTYMVGKHIFPRLVAVRMIDSVDAYPYIRDEKASEKRAKDSRLAGIALVGIFFAFALIDFYGWWRAATERNAAFCGDEGAILINPYFAGIAVMFLTCFMAGVKLASISAIANEIRNSLFAEVHRNSVRYEDAIRKYQADETEWLAKQGEAREYRDLLKQAHANVALRFRREMGPLAERIEAYREMVTTCGYDPNRFAEIDAEEARIAESAVDSIQHRFDAVAEVENKIDAVHGKAAEIMTMETPPREAVVEAPSESELIPEGNFAEFFAKVTPPVENSLDDRQDTQEE